MTNPAAPKSIFRFALIFALSASLYAFAPFALAQKGGSRGGGVSHGGGSFGGSSHGGAVSHSFGGFHAGGGSHSGGPYGGSGVSVHSGGGIRVAAPARMSSGGGHGLGFVRSAPRTNFTGESFMAPPAVARTVEGAARTIFINANAPAMSIPVGAHPFAAGNYLWEAPPQERQQPHPYVAPPPPPAVPRPMTMPAPTRPAVMQPPFSPIRPMPMPGATPMQGPRPIQMPVGRPGVIPVSPMPPRMPVPLIPPLTSPVPRPIQPLIQRTLGGRFVAPPLRALGPITTTPAPPLSRLFPPNNRVLPIRPVFAGMAVGSAPARKPLSFTAFAASNNPPHPCVTTFARCGLGSGVLDGDGDFDGDFVGPSIFFGFFGPFGYSPLGFGSTCILNAGIQDCFLSPVEFSPFGFNGFGFNWFGFGPFGGGWNSWGYAPYGSGYLYQPVENLPPYLPGELGGNLPNTNYSLSYSYLPAPEPLTQQQEAASPSANANASNANQPIVEVVLKDGIVFGVTSYWLLNDRLYYITTYQIQSSIPIDRLDLQKTVDMNWKRGVSFTLTPEPPTNFPQGPSEPQ